MEEKYILDSTILNQKCKDHPNYFYEHIHINQSTQTHKLCSKCLEVKDIAIENTISLQKILSASENTILSSYPPISDPQIYEALLILEDNPEYELCSMVSFFENLILKFQEELEKVRAKSKQQYSCLVEAKQKLSENYKKVSQLQKLQQILICDKNQDEEISSFINQIFNDADSIVQFLKPQSENLLKLSKSFSDREPQLIANNIISQLQSINFLRGQTSSILSILNEKSILKDVNLIFSQRANESSDLQIKKNEFDQIEVLHELECGNLFFYFDFIFNPDEKYIIRLKEEFLCSNELHFAVGLVTDSQKEFINPWSNEIAFYEYNNDSGISKMIKGNQLHSGSYSKNVDRSLEIRIHIKERLFKIGQLPNYDLVAELDDKNKIIPNTPYRLMFNLTYKGEKVIITEVIKVLNFNNQMD